MLSLYYKTLVSKSKKMCHINVYIVEVMYIKIDVFILLQTNIKRNYPVTCNL